MKPTKISYWLTPLFFKKYADGKHHAKTITVDSEGQLRIYMDGVEVPATPWFQSSEEMRTMTDEILGEVRIVFTQHSYFMRAITHKDGQSVEVDFGKVWWPPPDKRELHFKNLTIRLIQSSEQKANKEGA